MTCVFRPLVVALALSSMGAAPGWSDPLLAPPVPPSQAIPAPSPWSPNAAGTSTTPTPTAAGSTAPDALPLDLNTALRLGVENSPRLAELRARVEENDARVDEAYSQAYPQLDIGAGYNRVEPPVLFNFSGQTVELQPANNYQIALTMRQAIYTFGRLKWSTSVAELNRRSSQEDYRREAEQTFLEVAQLYSDAQLLAQNVDIVRQRLEAQQAQLDQAQQLFRGGTVARYDVLRAEAEVSRASQELLASENDARLAVERLATRLGLSPGTPVRLTDPLPSDLLAPPADLEAATAQALRDRPELGLLDWAIAATNARISLEDSNNAPRLDLQSQAVNRNVAGLAGVGTQWTNGIVLSVPLFDGGLSEARMQQARKAMEQLQHAQEGVRRSVRLEVRELFYLLQNLAQRHAVTVKNVAQAREALRVAQVRYREGLSTQVELLSAQSAYSDAQRATYQAERDYQVAQARWQRAISAPYPVAVPGPLLSPEERASVERPAPPATSTAPEAPNR